MKLDRNASRGMGVSPARRDVPTGGRALIAWAGRPCHGTPVAHSRKRACSTVLAAILLASLAGCQKNAAGPELPQATWLETGNGPGQTVYPRGIAYDEIHDWFYVVDRQARVQRLDGSGKFISGWTMPDFIQGKPVGISVGPDGNVWIPDTHYHRVMVYSPEGKEVRRWGGRGTEHGQFIYPTDIAFHEGKVYVAEYGDHDRVQVFTMTGEYLFEFGAFGQGPGEFSRPQSMVILGQEIFITDACNHRIVVFDVAGRFLRTLCTVGGEPGQLRFPYGLDADKEGNLIVTEFGNNRVQKLSREGKPLATWGTSGRDTGELAFPWASAVDKRGRIVIVDSGNNRLQVLGGL